MRFAGELAALGTTVRWAAGSNLFASAGFRMASMVLNRLRITVAALFLGVALWVTHGAPWPVWATSAQIALLAASGLIGFVLGDSYYLRALVILGPGRASLIASSVPIFTVALGWPLLGERLGPLAILGMALTCSGIAWVLHERERRIQVHIAGSALVGVTAGVLGAIGQAVGYVISKLALRSDVDPLSATVIRVGAAMAGIWVLAAARGEIATTLVALRDRRASTAMVAGAFCGPFLGVTLSLTALTYIQAGIAASITAVYPLLTFCSRPGFTVSPSRLGSCWARSSRPRGWSSSSSDRRPSQP